MLNTIVEFNYKKDNGEASKRQLLVLEEREDLLRGIDLGHLDEEEAKSLAAAAKVYADAIERCKPAFRSFKQANISGAIKLEKLEG